MKNILYVTIIILWLLLYSCSRCDYSTYTISLQQNDFMAFKTGSYWVMRDSLTGERDSFAAQVFDGYREMPIEKCADRYNNRIAYIYMYKPGSSVKDALEWEMEVNAAGSNRLYLKKKGIVQIATDFNYDFNNSALISNVFFNELSISEYVMQNGNKLTLHLDRSKIIAKIAFSDISAPYKKIWELEQFNIIK